MSDPYQNRNIPTVFRTGFQAASGSRAQGHVCYDVVTRLLTSLTTSGPGIQDWEEYYEFSSTDKVYRSLGNRTATKTGGSVTEDGDTNCFVRITRNANQDVDFFLYRDFDNTTGLGKRAGDNVSSNNFLLDFNAGTDDPKEHSDFRWWSLGNAYEFIYVQQLHGVVDIIAFGSPRRAIPHVFGGVARLNTFSNSGGGIIKIGLDRDIRGPNKDAIRIGQKIWLLSMSTSGTANPSASVPNGEVVTLTSVFDNGTGLLVSGVANTATFGDDYPVNTIIGLDPAPTYIWNIRDSNYNILSFSDDFAMNTTPNPAETRENPTGPHARNRSEVGVAVYHRDYANSPAVGDGLFRLWRGQIMDLESGTMRGYPQFIAWGAFGAHNDHDVYRDKFDDDKLYMSFEKVRGFNQQQAEKTFYLGPGVESSSIGT